MAKTKLGKYILSRIRTKLRLVIMKEETFEEKFAVRLTPLNTFIITGSVIILLITFTTYIIAFTPLREYIPGYADVGMKRNLIYLSLKTDSLTTKINSQALYIENLNKVISGKAGIEKMKDTSTTNKSEPIVQLEKSTADSQLRSMIESQDKYDLALDADASFSSSIAGFYFFTPLNGIITEEFNAKQKHYGVDIVGKPNEAIKSTLDGTVVFAGFTAETGYVIAVQHSNNIFSIYKHNSALLKGLGDYVKAGEVISIIGNSGQLSTGPHLHFELWYNGNPVNPKDYMSI